MMANLKKATYRTALGVLLLTCAAAQGATVTAYEIVLELDPVQTQIHFTLPDVLHTVHGTFQLKSGTIRFDAATGRVGGAVIVDVASGASGSAARDRKMHKTFWRAGVIPRPVFTPDRVEGRFASEGVVKLQVHGLFKIHGTEREMMFQTRVETKGDQLDANLHSVMAYPQWV
jgi:polyisoprenoid-binding protein YceI